ncbi:MAG TPA: hypothetical protein VLA72_18560 [Anaerolineales bacterium]|nr:hypothetical protein [Anaerolineales bacterium]
MTTFKQLIGRMMLQLRNSQHVVGWNMTPEEAVSFIRQRGKTVLTFFGYSGMGYEDEHAMLQTARHILKQYLPEKTLILIGATESGIGVVYRVAKALGFETAGIVTSMALEYGGLSTAVDHICFIEDTQWGGLLPNSGELSPTSRAMVDSSDILIAIGGNDISRDELLEGKKLGKPVQYFPADMNHERMNLRAERIGIPPPDSFAGSCHKEFGE